MNKYLLLLLMFISSFHFTSSFPNSNQYINLKSNLKLNMSLINRRSLIGSIPYLIVKKADASDNKCITQDKFIEYQADGILLFIYIFYLVLSSKMND